MPVGLIGLPHHALRQFKEPILMPTSHGRVAQPSYLGREPAHVTGQLLQLIHAENQISLELGGPGRRAATGR
jgi:hypothetical protein